METDTYKIKDDEKEKREKHTGTYLHAHSFAVFKVSAYLLSPIYSVDCLLSTIDVCAVLSTHSTQKVKVTACFGIPRDDV